MIVVSTNDEADKIRSGTDDVIKEGQKSRKGQKDKAEEM